MYTVYKYEVPIEDYFSLQIPKGSEILSFQTQRSTPCIWVKVDPENTTEERKFRFLGTGHPIEEENLSFIGTIKLHQGGLVFHLFEILD
ncbi:hypothetical protein CSB08_00235 [Candidatus Gracilibacteria bacterium]|nr:MAG: hypothetical protein CSB08_00235 [Candidatus Gracilibacteria bacterium]PIE85272.1 MAG: hypothetical protein CSA08_02585 [Candidatus Gracilibacteria bacterium]